MRCRAVPSWPWLLEFIRPAELSLLSADEKVGIERAACHEGLLCAQRVRDAKQALCPFPHIDF
jgi:hypothetical protein